MTLKIRRPLKLEDDVFHETYPSNKHYIKFVENVSRKISELNNAWEFYHHANDEELDQKNIYHPIHIRKPFVDVLSGTESIEEQDKRFEEQAEIVLEIVTSEESFWSLRNDLEQGKPLD